MPALSEWQQLLADLATGVWRLRKRARESDPSPGMRRDLDAYENAPPHVRAARMRAASDDDDGNESSSANEVEYVMTVRGPEPIDRRNAALDYKHYVEKQLAPAVDVVLPLLGTSFDRVAGTQLTLF